MTDRFINAAKGGVLDILREGTKKDLNTPGEDGMTPTLWAAHTGNLEALRLIVGREGDVDKVDYQGMSALHHAALRGHMSIVSYLVHWGCNVYALDNDHQTAMDLAALYDRTEIVRFLDANIAEKEAKNPKQTLKLKGEAMKAADNNVRRYEKKADSAAKKAKKEYERMQMEMDLQLKQQNGSPGVNSKTKPGFFQTLTIRIKGGPNTSNKFDSLMYRRQSSAFSEAAGMTGTRGGIAKRIHMNRLDSISPSSIVGEPDFRVTDLDDTRSLNQGLSGSTSGVFYVTGDKNSRKGELTLRKGNLYHSSMYRAKSESELLDSGTDTYNEEDEDENNSGGIFNRPGVGKMAFLPKNPFLNTFQSFEDTLVPSSPNEVNGDSMRLYGENGEMVSSERGVDTTRRQAMPWDQEDLGNLDDDEEDEDGNELSTVNMFLWSCGLASYLHIFSKEKIDMQVLTQMTDSELKELEIPLGPRKKLRDAITRRKTILETPTKMTDTHL